MATVRLATLALLMASAALIAPSAHAQTASGATLPTELATPAAPSGQAVAQATGTAPTPTAVTYQTGVSGYFENWFARSDAAKAEQPHWITPLVTVTPRLEQEVRYDQYWEHLGTGANIDQYDSGKGLELIPTETNEVLLNPPPYLDRSVKKPAQGWNDWAFLTVKQRLLSANEQSGDYIVTAFLGFQAPSGNAAFTNHAWLVTPTIAGGWGIGDFDVQSTLGVALPVSHGATIGNALAWNTAFQYHLTETLWPEFETNITHWYGGERDGKTQVFLTPGLIVGRFPLAGRVVGIVGAGYQFAVSPKLVTTPALTPTYQHAWIFTARAAF
jgi:hypothetical protein